MIFDLDGTLVDSLRDLSDAVNHVLGELRLPPHDLDAYRRFIGDGASMLVRRALGEHAQELHAEALDRFRARYFGRPVVHTAPYPGVEALLASLWERAVPTAVLSNKPHAATVAVVDALFPGHRFVRVLGEREGVPRKPDPSAALELARAFGVPPREVALVGDTQNDVATARAAGMLAIGARWGFRPEEVESADVVASDAGELRAWLEREAAIE